MPFALATRAASSFALPQDLAFIWSAQPAPEAPALRFGLPLLPSPVSPAAGPAPAIALPDEPLQPRLPIAPPETDFSLSPVPPVSPEPPSFAAPPANPAPFAAPANAVPPLPGTGLVPPMPIPPLPPEGLTGALPGAPPPAAQPLITPPPPVTGPADPTLLLEALWPGRDPAEWELTMPPPPPFPWIML